MNLKWAGAGMMLGGFLFFTRMGPVFQVVPEDMAFPPGSAADLARLAELAGGAWPLSHAMGLVAVILFCLGYWAQARALANAGHRQVGVWAASIATLAFGAFSIALVIDGFLLPATAEAYRAGERGLDQVGAVHAQALFFFTPAIFIMFIAMGVLSSRLLHGFIHSRWLGMLGMTLAILGPTAYLFGVTGPNWDNLQIGGSLMMAAFVWHFLIGCVSLFGRGVRPKS